MNTAGAVREARTYILMNGTPEPVKKIVVLTTFANDQDAYLELLRSEEEAISQCLTGCEAVDHINVPNATIDKIFNAFNSHWNNIGIFHYAGHANGTHLRLEDTQANQFLDHVAAVYRDHEANDKQYDHNPAKFELPLTVLNL